MTAPRSSVAQTWRWLLLALAGGAASLLRFVVTDAGGWAPLVLVNVAGCALLAALIARDRATPVLAAGFCGGLTTFSGIMLQARAADHAGAWSAAGSAALPAGAAGAVLVIALNAALGCAAFFAVGRLARRQPASAVAP